MVINNNENILTISIPFTNTQEMQSALSPVCLFVCLFDLILYITVNNFSAMPGWVFLGLTSTKQEYMCLAQGHNTMTPVRLEPAAPRSRVKHSTTEPLCSLSYLFVFDMHNCKQHGPDQTVLLTLYSIGYF